MNLMENAKMPLKFASGNFKYLRTNTGKRNRE